MATIWTSASGSRDEEPRKKPASVGAGLHGRAIQALDLVLDGGGERGRGRDRLGATGVDTYHLFSKVPLSTYGDLKGRKISAPGSIGLWLKGSGAVAVDGSLTSFYTDIQSGVSEGVLSIATGILPNKIYEVAPYVTTINIGALYIGGMAMNKDSFEKLPPDVQKIVKDVGKEYSKALGDAHRGRLLGADLGHGL